MRVAGQALVELTLVIATLVVLIAGGAVLLVAAITAFATTTAVNDLGREIAVTGRFDAATEASFVARATSLGAPIAPGLDELTITVDDGTTSATYGFGDTVSEIAYGDLITIAFSRRISVGGLEQLAGLPQPVIRATYTGIAQRNGADPGGGGGPVVRPGTIVGFVRDVATNGPIAGALVSVAGAGTAVSGIDGAFQVSPVDPGTRTVTATAGGYRAGSASVSLAGSSVATVSISLRATATITVTLAGGVTGATVVTSTGLLATEIGGGTYRLAVPGGTFTVVAYSGALSGSGSVSVPVGGAATLAISLS